MPARVWRMCCNPATRTLRDPTWCSPRSITFAGVLVATPAAGIVLMALKERRALALYPNRAKAGHECCGAAMTQISAGATKKGIGIFNLSSSPLCGHYCGTGAAPSDGIPEGTLVLALRR